MIQPNPKIVHDFLKRRWLLVSFAAVATIVVAGPLFVAWVERQRTRQLESVVKAFGGKFSVAADGTYEVNLNGKRVESFPWEILDATANRKKLYLYESNCSNNELKQISCLTSIEALWLDETPVSDAGVVFLRQSENLKVLLLQGTSITDRSLHLLAERGRLKELAIGSTHVGDKGISALADLPLTGLKIDETAVTDASAASIGQIHTLVRLNLSRNEITDEFFLTDLVWPKIEILRLNETQITEKSIPKLAMFKSLKHLNIERTPLGMNGGGSKIQTLLPRCEVHW